MAKSSQQKDQKKLVKKCPYCQSYVKVEASKCAECNKKIGPVGRDGIALKPVDWKAYTLCIVSWGALFAYFWVLGWSEPMLIFLKHLYANLKIWSVKILLAIWGVLVGTWETILEVMQRVSNLFSG